MKIAIVSDPHFPVSPEKYGGTERHIAYLIDGLVKLGHQVTLFAPGNSSVPCEIIPCSPRHLDVTQEGVTFAAVKQAQDTTMKHVVARQNEFDIINWYAHVHKGITKIHRPFLFTVSNPIPSRFSAEEILLLQSFHHTSFSALSRRFTEVNRQIRYFTYIYNGVPIERFPFSATTKHYISFVGRFSQEKQPHIALQAALALRKKIVIGARMDAFGMAYYERYCGQLMKNDLVEYKGEVTDKEKIALFQHAEVNLHPVLMEEPFGLSVVEAGLCGTPTIAFDKGAMRELINDGVSGYIVRTLDELIAIYPKAVLLDRKKVRDHFLQFNHIRMAKEYEKTYKQIIQNKRKRSPVPV